MKLNNGARKECGSSIDKQLIRKTI